MRLGIMQPYFFPYIGYFQLINAVDRLVIYDDVTFIKQGWINRNRILALGKDLMITVPLKEQSSFKAIRETMIADDHRWKTTIKKSINQYYSRAPYFGETSAIVNRVLESDSRNIGQIASLSIREVCGYLGIEKTFVEDCSVYANHHLKGQERVIDICRQENADEYINAIGGRGLYNQEDFKKAGIRLFFLESRPIEYKQCFHSFVPWLSIIDVLMFNPIEKIKEFLMEFELRCD